MALLIDIIIVLVLYKLWDKVTPQKYQGFTRYLINGILTITSGIVLGYIIITIHK